MNLRTIAYALIALCLPLSAQIGQKMFVEELQDFNNNVADPKTELVIDLIKENSTAFQSKKQKDALSYDAMKDIVKQEVKNSKKQKELLKWVEHYEIIADFLRELAGGDPKKSLALLKKNTYLASIKDPITGNTPLALVIKNYSFVSKEEDKLLKKLVELNPAALNSTIWNDISTFSGHTEKYDEQLKQLIKDALKKVKINKEQEKRLADALANKNYEVAANLVKEHPELVYFKDSNNKTLLEHIQSAQSPYFNSIEYMVKALQ